jgi:hypothetical protein
LFFVIAPAVIGSWADSVVSVSLGGTSSCRYNCTSGGSESVFATFRLNTVTDGIIPDSMVVTSTGPVEGSFCFWGWSMHTPGQPEFDFRNASADIFQLTLFPTGTLNSPGAMFPDAGVYFGNTNVICGSATDTCSYYGLDGLTQGRTKATVVTVPEPDGWALLVVVGLFGVTFLRRGIPRG